MSGSETIFERILHGGAPADVVYEDEHVLAFRDLRPQAPVHVLVIPKKRARNLSDLREWDATGAGGFIRGVAAAAASLGLEEAGYRVVMNCGRHGQQSVDYLHAHILGGRQLHWPPG
jgi:histidine triad (HIT) family protein